MYTYTRYPVLAEQGKSIATKMWKWDPLASEIRINPDTLKSSAVLGIITGGRRQIANY
jgi:hypothetical protein